MRTNTPLGYSEEFLKGLQRYDRIYMRVHKGRREVTFHRTYQEGRKRGGAVYRFNGKERSKIYQRIQYAWKGFSKYELDQWKAPEWMLDWYKRSRKNYVRATMVGNTFIIKFDLIPTPFIITKRDSFFLMYDKQRYLYDTILDIANYSGVDNVYILTDMVDILRINRLSYSRSELNIIVRINKMTDLKEELIDILKGEEEGNGGEEGQKRLN